MNATAEFGYSWKNREHHPALAHIRDWTRERFGLPVDAAILVSELACAMPGCPPMETVVVFWIGETRHHFKFFKRAGDVVLADFPPAWLRNALAPPEGAECDCW